MRRTCVQRFGSSPQHRGAALACDIVDGIVRGTLVNNGGKAFAEGGEGVSSEIIAIERALNFGVRVMPARFLKKRSEPCWAGMCGRSIATYQINGYVHLSRDTRGQDGVFQSVDRYRFSFRRHHSDSISTALAEFRHCHGSIRHAV